MRRVENIGQYSLIELRSRIEGAQNVQNNGMVQKGTRVRGSSIIEYKASMSSPSVYYDPTPL